MTLKIEGNGIGAAANGIEQPSGSYDALRSKTTGAIRDRLARAKRAFSSYPGARGRRFYEAFDPNTATATFRIDLLEAQSIRFIFPNEGWVIKSGVLLDDDSDRPDALVAVSPTEVQEEELTVLAGVIQNYRDTALVGELIDGFVDDSLGRIDMSTCSANPIPELKTI